MAFLDSAGKIIEDWNLSIEVYGEPTYHLVPPNRLKPPTGTQVGCNQNLQHRAKEVFTTTKGNRKVPEHIKTALQTFSCPDCTFTKTSKKWDPSKEENRNKPHSFSIAICLGIQKNWGESSKNRKFQYSEVQTLQHTQTKLVHPKDN